MPLTQPITLDRDSPIPLYYQIAQQIESAIDRGDLKAGETIASEIEFADQLGVSRPTIRQAIQQLVLKGFMVRRRGIGTVVIHRRIHRSASTSSLFDALLASGREPRTSVLSLTVQPAAADVSTTLQIPPATSVLVIERIRYADDEPVALMNNHVPISIFDTIPTKEELEGVSLYSLIRRRGIEMDFANQEIAARGATPKEATALKASRGATLLTMTRTAFDTNNIPIELGRHVYLADRYSFEMTLPIH